MIYNKFMVNFKFRTIYKPLERANYRKLSLTSSYCYRRFEFSIVTALSPYLHSK